MHLFNKYNLYIYFSFDYCVPTFVIPYKPNFKIDYNH